MEIKRLSCDSIVGQQIIWVLLTKVSAKNTLSIIPVHKNQKTVIKINKAKNLQVRTHCIAQIYLVQKEEVIQEIYVSFLNEGKVNINLMVRY